MNSEIKKAVELLKNSSFTTAFTGAGISVESGIPPFRGGEGIWARYDPASLDINMFMRNPEKSWKVIKEIFYEFMGKAKPNKAHFLLAEMEKEGYLHRLITQNIDNLHQEAGSISVYEFHGNSKNLVCLACYRTCTVHDISLDDLPPRCTCGGLLKPDFVFFGEGIPETPMTASFEAASISNVFLIIGTTGEVVPANQIPVMAKHNGATIIEINPEESAYTHQVTDIFLKGKATEIMEIIAGELLQIR